MILETMERHGIVLLIIMIKSFRLAVVVSSLGGLRNWCAPNARLTMASAVDSLVPRIPNTLSQVAQEGAVAFCAGSRQIC